MESEYLHFGLNLLAILGLLAGLAFLLKKIRTVKSVGNKQIKIINIVSVGPKEKIILLEVNGFTLLVGVTANQIATLHRFSDFEPAISNDMVEPVFSDEMLKLMK